MGQDGAVAAIGLKLVIVAQCVTGGTGSFGKAFLKRQLNNKKFSEIRIFSRDEKKQDDMRRLYQSSKIKYFLGDVREKSSISNAMIGADLVFHAAAYKHVPIQELHPWSAVNTNLGGTLNLVTLSDNYLVDKFVLVSTDKAVNPTNVMGATKRLAEMITQNFNRIKNFSIVYLVNGMPMRVRSSLASESFLALVTIVMSIPC